MEDLHSLCLDLQKSALHSLEFPIGGQEEIYLGDHRKPNGAYVENALSRALALLTLLPGTLDLLMIRSPLADCGQDLRRLRLSNPLQIENFQGQEQLYWSLSGTREDLRPLLREIIRSEISPEGMDFLCGSVFLASSREGWIFHLYDDRGARICGRDSALLKAVSENFTARML